MKALVIVVPVLLVVGTAFLRHGPCFCMSTTEAAEIFTNNTMPAILDRFHQDVGRYPSSREGLSALLRAPETAIDDWKGPYVEGSAVPKDPWGHEYRYRVRAGGAGFEILSLGPDGVISSDDIFASQ